MLMPRARFRAFFALATLGFSFHPQTSLAIGEDLDFAPPSFAVHALKAIPIDFQHAALDIEFDVPNKKALGHSRIEFFADEEGNPMLDFVPDVTKVVLNGETLSADSFKLIDAPSGSTKLRVVDHTVARRSTNVLELWFELPSKVVTFTSTGVRMVWAMSDLDSPRQYLEQYAPSNLEFDQFPMDFSFNIVGASRAHEVFANGQISREGEGSYKIRFPKYFTSSSFFFHVTDKTVSVARDTFDGLNGKIPVTVYQEGTSSMASTMEKTKKVMKELEETYGPYAHESMTVYLTGLGGGMEHCGATITSSWALGHEITHSWFARGVMPADGNAGWIDEAIASWRDDGYPSKAQDLTGSAVNLAGFSPYHRITPNAAYTKGARLLSGFDNLFGGLKNILREVFSRKKNETITTPMFEKMLHQFGGKDVSDYFKLYVYNQTSDSLPLVTNLMPRFEEEGHWHHPRPFTQAEIEQLR